VHVLWHCAELASSEHARVQLRGPSMSAEGVAALALGDEPCDLSYRVDVGPLSTSAVVDVRTPAGSRRLELSNRDGEWTVDGRPAPDLAGCTEVDLGWTPATNTTAIRRLDLDVGGEGTVRVAWLRFPELVVEAADQRYARSAEDRWRFGSEGFAAELVVDPATGVVRAYGDDLWRAVAWRAVEVHPEVPPLAEP
jgi:hypothetical protein